MRRAPEPKSDDIDISLLGSLALKRLPMLLVLSAIVGAATFGAFSLVAPRYSSEALLTITSRSPANPYSDPARMGASDYVTVRMDKEAINTHVRALQSGDLAAYVAREMKLSELVEFNNALGPPDRMSAILRMIGIGLPRENESDEARTLDEFAKRLEVYSAKESRAIAIRFSSSDPDLAAAIANRIADTYRELLARQALNETDAVQQALEPQIERLAAEAAAAEAAVEKFRGEADIFRGSQQQTGLNEQQLAELHAELSRIKATRSEAEARARQAKEMAMAGSADALADVQKSPLVQNLVQSRVRLERQISELSATLLPGHPRMRQLNADLAGLKVQIKTEVAKIVDSLAKEAKVAALREDALTKSINEVKNRIVDTGPDEAKLRSLEADARSKRSELERLRSQFEANRARGDDRRSIPVEAQIVSQARAGRTPVFPKKTASAVLAALATLLFGLALVVTHGLLRGARRIESHAQSRDEIVPVLPVPSNAAPANPKREPLAAKVAAPAPATAPAPAHQELRTEGAPQLSAIATELEAIRQRGPSGARSLLATEMEPSSAAPEIMRLGAELTSNGQTAIIVDWSEAGHGIAEVLGAPSAPGLIEVVNDEASFEDAIVALSVSSVHFLPAGAGGKRLDTLDQAAVNNILDALDSVYEQILIVARSDAAADLLQMIEGRVDAGITFTTPASRNAAPAGTFLGFEVEGMTLISHVVELARATSPRRRLVRAS